MVNPKARSLQVCSAGGKSDEIRSPKLKPLSISPNPKEARRGNKQGGVMKLGKLGKALAIGGFGLALLSGVESVSAQNTREEYREWQDAQRRAQEEYRDYLRTGSRRDYRDWQQAQRIAQREYIEYQRTSRYDGYNRGYNNSGYYNNGNRMRTGWYRINRGGSYYEVDQRGISLLRQAVNSGYQQGYNAGIRDRRYGRDSSYYYNNNVYRMGTFGYQSYVTRDQYQYYFQQGFQRGYQDAMNGSFQYGYRTNTGLNILGNVLNTILQVVD